MLVTADTWGIDSHGVARLPAYFEMLRRGLINPRPQIKVVRDYPVTAVVDADNGLGLVVGPRANEMAMEKAEAAGAGMGQRVPFKSLRHCWLLSVQSTRARTYRLGHDKHAATCKSTLGRGANAWN